MGKTYLEVVCHLEDKLLVRVSVFDDVARPFRVIHVQLLCLAAKVLP